jgi:hypothetical protein
MSDIYLDALVSREKKKERNVRASWNFVLPRFYFVTCTPVCISCDTDCSVGPESANSMISLKYPQEGMFIVSCWSLREAGPVCSERCMLVDECLSSFFNLFFLIFLQGVSLFYTGDILYSV